MDYTVWLQSLLELALSVSGEQETKALYLKSSRAFLRKFDGTAFLLVSKNGHINFSAPKNALTETAVSHLISKSLGKLPYVIEYQGQFAYVYDLKDEGYLIFMRANSLPDAVVRELNAIVERLAVNIIGAKATERMKEIEHTLREERSFLRMVIDNIPDMIFYKNSEGLYKLVNKATAEAFGLTVEEMMGKVDLELHPPSEAKWYKSLDAHAVELGHTYSYEGDYINSKGEQRFVETALTPFSVESEVSPGVIGIARDVTKRKAVQALIDRRMAFQKILMHLALSFINVELDDLDTAIRETLESAGTFVGADRAYVFEYHFEEGVMHNTYEWCGEGVEPAIHLLQYVDIEPFMKGFVEKHLEGDLVHVPNVDRLSKDDPVYEVLAMQDIKSMIGIPLMLSKQCLGFIGFDAVFETRLFDEDEVVLLKVLAEILSNAMGRKRHENALLEAKHMAEEANRAKSSFLANMSHEIRTPLNGIVGMMYLLKDTPISSAQKEYIQIIDDSIDALLSIINNILDFSKIEAGQLKLDLSRFDFEEEVFKVCGMVKTRVSEQVEIIVDYADHCPKMFLGDRGRIRQILINLIGNAVKFTHEGSIVIRVTYEGGCLVFSVADTGVGISKTAQEVVFEQFTQEDDSSTKKYEGTGLGLAITKQLIEIMDGHIELKSEVGKGSTFTVILPMDFDEEHSEAYYGFDFLKRKKALIVDDHPINRKILMAYLEEWGIEFDSVATGVDAILEIEMSFKSGEPYDMILLDLAMPEMDGFTLAKIISSRKEWSSLKLVLLSSMVGVYEENSEDTQYFDAVMSKPFSKRSLYKELANLFRQSLKDEPIGDFEKLTIEGEEAKGLKILIVDDNGVNRMAVRHIMQKWGYEVLEASNGYEAVEMAKQSNFSLILMDIHMPGMDGYETTKAIRALSGEKGKVPVVALSANALDQDRKKSLAAGMSGHIGKPFKVEELIKIRETIKEHKEHVAYVFDEVQLVKQFEDDLDLISDVLAVYHSDFDSFIQRMMNAYKAQDCDAVKDLAHELKGASSYVSANRIVSLCSEIMASCKKKSREEIFRAINDMENEGKLFIETSKVWLEARSDD